MSYFLFRKERYWMIALESKWQYKKQAKENTQRNMHKDLN